MCSIVKRGIIQRIIFTATALPCLWLFMNFSITSFLVGSSSSTSRMTETFAFNQNTFYRCVCTDIYRHFLNYKACPVLYNKTYLISLHKMFILQSNEPFQTEMCNFQGAWSNHATIWTIFRSHLSVYSWNSIIVYDYIWKCLLYYIPLYLQLGLASKLLKHLFIMYMM